MLDTDQGNETGSSGEDTELASDRVKLPPKLNIQYDEDSTCSQIDNGASTATSLAKESRDDTTIAQMEKLIEKSVTCAPHSCLDYMLFEYKKSFDNSVETDASTLQRYVEGTRHMKIVADRFSPDPSIMKVVYTGRGIAKLNSPHDVVVKVQASTVSPQDCLSRRGFCYDFIKPVELPLTPGQDIVGHIVNCGDEVKDFKEGDRVAALVRTGGNTRYISVPHSSLVKVPSTVDPAEAAAMVAVYATAYRALKTVSDSDGFTFKKTKILIVGGMDAIGQAIIHMCSRAKATVYATSPQDCHGFIREIGAKPLPEDRKGWLPQVHGKMDLVFDGVWEDGLETSTKALNATGKVICFGSSSMLKEQVGFFGASMSAHFNKFWSEAKYNTKVIDIWEVMQKEPDAYKKHVTSLFQLLKNNNLRPRIAARVALDEVADWHSKIETSTGVEGTVVCLPWKMVRPHNYLKSLEVDEFEEQKDEDDYDDFYYGENQDDEENESDDEENESDDENDMFHCESDFDRGSNADLSEVDASEEEDLREQHEDSEEGSHADEQPQ